MTAIELHHRLIHTTVVDIATAKQTAGFAEERVRRCLRFVFYLLLIAFIDVLGLIVIGALVIIAVTYITVVQRQVGSTEHGTTLTATIGVTLHGGDTGFETCSSHIANHHMGLTWDITSWQCAGCTIVATHITQPSAAIDVTATATIYICIGTGGKAKGILRFTGFGINGGIKVTHTEEVIDSTGSTSSIDILIDGAAKQGDISRTIHVTTQMCLSFAITATVCVVHYRSTFLDAYVGVESLVDASLGSIFYCFVIICISVGIFIGRIVAIVYLGKVGNQVIVGEVRISIIDIIGIVGIGRIVVT